MEGKASAQIHFPSFYIFQTDQKYINKCLNPKFQRYISRVNYKQIDYDIWDMNSRSTFFAFQRQLFRIMFCKFVDNTILLVVMLNMIFMMLDGLVSDQFLNQEGKM